MPTKRQLQIMREVEMKFPETRRSDDPMYKQPSSASNDAKLPVIRWKAFPQVKPNSAGWYLVCVQTVDDLGVSSYVDVISYAHNAVEGNYWAVEHGGVVVAWAEVEKPSFL